MSMNKNFEDIKFVNNGKNYIIKSCCSYNGSQRTYHFLAYRECYDCKEVTIDFESLFISEFDEKKFLIKIYNLITDTVNKDGLGGVYEYFKEYPQMNICGHNFMVRTTPSILLQSDIKS